MQNIKIAFVIALLLCWLPMPYGYYQFIRFGGLVIFGILAYQEWEAKNNNKAILYIILAILFQPFEKIALGRSLWNIVDTAVAGWLILESFNNKQNNK
ncbi:DUF6804 family protein [Bergeyella zoohelcum]|uniref:Uncharacterized protein n=1 Tax=Bergeyella zoohelcum TaxID=1015 RepID=A0A7Z8YQQ8_9FLAO|nr:DUF6804 family protein [Bergeyella zoohelcum]VDH05175.1 Uncharacterised protein [Bergeyella zoohelcum]